jgi:hypothetical protein
MERNNKNKGWNHWDKDKTKTYKETMKWKVGSLKKNYTIDESLANLSKTNTEKIEISKIRNIKSQWKPMKVIESLGNTLKICI